MGNASVRAGSRLKQILLAAVGVQEIYGLLKEVEKPGKALAAIVKRFTKLVEKQADTGEEIKPEDLKSIYKDLKKLDEKPEQVNKALKFLKEFLGIEDEEGESPAMGDQPAKGETPNLDKFLEKLKMPEGNLSSYQKSSITASVKPGVYIARLIKAGKALDGKVWLPQALKAAVDGKLFENRPVKVMTFKGKYGKIDNHLPDDMPFSGSLFGNDVGFVKNAKWDPTERAVYASIWITDPARRNLVDAMIDEGVELPGMSIYASGTLTASNEVTLINTVDSMDLVTFPAAEGRILSRALTASLKRVKAADEMMPEQGPGQQEQPPQQPQQPDGNLPMNEGPEFGEKFIDGKVDQTAKEMTGGEVAPDLQQKLDGIKSDIKGLDYDKTKYPIELVIAIINKTWAAVGGKSEDKEETAGEPVMPEKEQEKPEQVANKPALGGSMGSLRDKQVLANLGQRLQSLEDQSKYANREAMVAEKLEASGLPGPIQLEMAKNLKGSPVDEKEVDAYITSQKRIVASMNQKLAKTGVDINGNYRTSHKPGDVVEAMKSLLGAKEFKREDN